MELITYEDGFEKANKETLIQAAQVTIEEMIESGLVDPRLEYAKIRKAMVFFEQAEQALRPHAMEECEKFGKENSLIGVALTIKDGTTRLQYKDDHIVSELSNKLKERQALVKTSTNTKEQIFDGDGVEVTKVARIVSGRNLSASVK